MKNFLTLPYNAEIKAMKPKASTLYFSMLFLAAFMSVVSFSVSRYVADKLAFEIPSEELYTGEDADSVATISEVYVKRNDTLGKIFTSQNISPSDIAKIDSALKAANINFTLKPGQLLYFDYSVSEEDKNNDFLNDYSLKEITINIDSSRSIVIYKSAGNFMVEDVLIPLKRMFIKHHVTIKNNFVDALTKLGISAANVQELVRAYSYDVDFQRQIKAGDTISIICEKFYAEDGKFAHNGKILFSSLNLSGNKHNIYWFSDGKNNKAQYYSEAGRSIKRNLLRTPINVARISSSFGKRHHPVLGYTKMHKGVDFAAPSGTPILAAGDGIVTEIGYRGAYGNIVKIKHSANLTTAYAHASRFAKSLRPGTKVKQGQIIAYVGATGRATGPHCHFEVIINGKHVNPVSVQTTPGIELKNDSLQMFTKHKKILRNYIEKLPENTPLELANL